MARSSYVVRLPAFVAGLCISALVLPFDYAQMCLQLTARHCLIALTRLGFAPLAIVISAVADHELWPRYLVRWQQAHDRVKIRWRRPLQRFTDLGEWLPVQARTEAAEPGQWSRFSSSPGSGIPSFVRATPSSISSRAA
jgi:hypothetical protein